MPIEQTKGDARRRDFMVGARASIPIIAAVLPFGLLFGALAVDNGLTGADAMLMSGIIFGGASQMVGIQLFGEHVAPWLIVLSIFAVNFRHVLYSAAFGRRISSWPLLQKALGFFLLTDPQFAEAERRIENGQPLSFAWYIGMGAPIWLFAVAMAGLGAHFGTFVQDPRALGLDFLLPIYFLGMVMSFRKRPLWLPVVAVSAVASVLAVRLVGSPWHIALGAIAGIAIAVAMPIAPVPETELKAVAEMEEGDL
jgi:predicted branched-subunit amino acid permease